MSAASHRIPWFEPSLDSDDAEAVRSTVLSTYVNEGTANRAFERILTEYFDVPYAVTTPSCTVAIALSLLATGVRHGDTVLVPDVTFVGTASAVRLTGAEPILVDVDPRTFNMDPADAARRIRPDTKAIVPVHLNGRPADLDALDVLARDKGLILVEDAAEALASRNAKGFLGTQSEAGCFSLAPTKVITTGQGGFVLTREQETRDRLVRLKDHGRLSRSSDVHPVTGFNFKVTDLQGALAISQWRKLDARLARGREIDRLYREELADVREIEFTPRPGYGGHLMWPDFKTPRRDELCAFLSERGIMLRPFWPALHEQPAYASAEPYPGATDVAHHACWLPCSPTISNEQIARVIGAIRGFFAR